MSTEMSVEEMRNLRNKSEFYASLIADQTILAGKAIVPEDICEAFVDGYKERDAEVKELKDVILEMSVELERSTHLLKESYSPLLADALEIDDLLIKHSKLIERLKQERGE